MKKVIYSPISLGIVWGSFCVAAMAATQSSTASSPFNQTRIGFGIAGEYINAGASLKVKPVGDGGDTLTDLPQAIASSQSHLGRALQIALCVELGGMIANDYYLGLHTSWRFSGITNKSTTPIRSSQIFSHEFKVDHYIDILLKPGYKINPCTMIYGLVGPTIAKWSHTTDQINGVGNRLVDKFNINRKSVGLGLGLGFEYLFRKKYALSFDYTHHFHRSVVQTQKINLLDGGPPRSGNLTKRIQPSYGVLAARFTIFFNL
jgi:opacity protein-like surface antigen